MLIITDDTIALIHGIQPRFLIYMLKQSATLHHELLSQSNTITVRVSILFLYVHHLRGASTSAHCIPLKLFPQEHLISGIVRTLLERITYLLQEALELIKLRFRTLNTTENSRHIPTVIPIMK